jgi:Protein of unknown function (DUF732)
MCVRVQAGHRRHCRCRPCAGVKDLLRISHATKSDLTHKTIQQKENNAVFSSRLTQPVVVAGMIGLAALLAAGTANAEGADDQFLGALQQQGVGFGSTQSAITVAHHVCDALGQGMEPGDISGNITGANSCIDRQTALVIVVAAAQAYCPQYVHEMANGATVSGPDH